MKVVLVYNRSSGGEYGLRSIKSLLKKHGVTVSYSFTVNQLGSKKLHDLVKAGVTVMAIGGDGTLNAVARKLVGTKSVLLPNPGGTFNHFVRDLGMLPNLEENLAHLTHAKTQKIDVGYVNGELFLNNSNIGLYPFSLVERKQTKKILGKWPAALLSMFDQLAIFRRHKLSIDGSVTHSPFVFVGNNVFDIESSLIPARSRLNEGLLTVMISSSRSRISFFRAVIAVVSGDVSNRNDFSVETRKSLEIYSHRHQLLVSFDGEVKKLHTPLKYVIKPKSLKVMTVTP